MNCRNSLKNRWTHNLSQKRNWKNNEYVHGGCSKQCYWIYICVTEQLPSDVH